MSAPATSRSGKWIFLMAILLLGVGALLATTWQKAQRAQTALRQAQAQAGQLEERVATAEASAARAENLQAEVDRLQRETRELHELRGEYQAWQHLKQEHEKLQTQYQKLQQSQQTLAASLRSARTSGPKPAAWIGITMDQAHQGGAKVQSVVPGGPSAKSGLQVGDIIVSANGRPVRSSNDLRTIVAGMQVGQSVNLTTQREGRTLLLRARTGAFPQ